MARLDKIILTDYLKSEQRIHQYSWGQASINEGRFQKLLLTE